MHPIPGAMVLVMPAALNVTSTHTHNMAMASDHSPHVSQRRLMQVNGLQTQGQGVSEQDRYTPWNEHTPVAGASPATSSC
mmetsp:Transcript_24034/g.52560  ORF Transcript_24034/g.52560 Transcript_24034/m.52560 type:complete len:80 (-) Transcript_24034:2393-2632(-)